ncbi:ATP-dependent DNA ligase [Chelativorans sp. AA-79]|uniref:ATP-dependent DNA ligase n=1 Tax=Chelativorans sp. AA-79 TaxID=3028735 RepID=UPI0023F93A14|nr:ATP-dependent DNA ligase [Chelativorans sp. AA-79]WEX10395.1 ATP-dependent DNA ligase [Chelativorans sp. AA-79]
MAGRRTGQPPEKTGSSSGLAAPLPPMEAKSVAVLPEESGWEFEPKWDGFRCLAHRSGEEIELYAKSGKPLGRYFPEVVEIIRSLPGDHFVLDGELVIPTGGTLSFDALQLRLHPAESRIRRLARETPAILILFDMPMKPGGESLTDAPLTVRRAALERFVAEVPTPGIRLSPYTRDRAEAEAWLARAGGALDGVIAKRLDGPYESGERAMLKVKRIRSADCVVGGFRYGKDSELVGSLLLGLFDEEGRLNHVGFTSMISNEERPSLTRRLERLKGPPGFTGRAPGGPSRWSNARSSEWEPLRHDLVVEVAYDQVTGDRFRHGTRFLRWRPDKAPHQCTFEQIEREAHPGRLIKDVID